MLQITSHQCKIILSMLALVLSLPATAATSETKLPNDVKKWMTENNMLTLITIDDKANVTYFNPNLERVEPKPECAMKGHEIPQNCIDDVTPTHRNSIRFEIGNQKVGKKSPKVSLWPISPAYAGGSQSCVIFNEGGQLIKICR